MASTRAKLSRTHFGRAIISTTSLFTFTPGQTTGENARQPEGESPVPVIANLPHSGLLVPESIQTSLTEEHQRFLPNQDWHLEHLYDFLPSLGVDQLKANYSRYVVDLNRRLKEPWFGSFWQSPIAQRTAFKAQLYQTEPDQQALAARIDDYYKPYHERLTRLLKARLAVQERVVLLDLHSFASGLDADVCLGTCGGVTAAPDTLETLYEAFRSEGFACVKNQVFNGGHITRHYAQLEGVETIQIELHYRAYLDPQQLLLHQVPDWKVPAFTQARQRLQRVLQRVVEHFPDTASLQ